MIARCLIGMLRVAGEVGVHRDRMFDEASDILIVETTRFGDLIAALPAAQRLCSKYKAPSCTVVAHAAHASLFEAIDFPCTVIPFPWPEDPATCAAALLRVRSRRFDLACSMSPSRKNALVTLSAKARWKIGYFTHRASPTPHLEESSIESVGRRLPALHVPLGDSLYMRASRVAEYVNAPPLESFRLQLRPMQDQRWEALRARLGIPSGSRFVVIHPFAGWAYRAWPQDHVVRLCEMFHELGGIRPVVIGSRSDFASAADPGRERLAAGGASVLALESWSDTAVLLSHASAFVGTDSGPLHLAAALGIPVVGLYGPATPALTAPPLAAGEFLYSSMPCSPCDQIRCVTPAAPCMPRLTPRRAFDALESILPRMAGVVVNG